MIPRQSPLTVASLWIAFFPTTLSTTTASFACTPTSAPNGAGESATTSGFRRKAIVKHADLLTLDNNHYYRSHTHTHPLLLLASCGGGSDARGMRRSIVAVSAGCYTLDC